MKIVEFDKKAEDNGPQKHVYEFELYTKDGPNESREHYGFLSFGDFVAIVDDRKQLVACYPYGRVAGIIAKQDPIGGVN